MNRTLRLCALLMAGTSALPALAQSAGTPAVAGASAAAAEGTQDRPAGDPAVTGAQGPDAPTTSASTADENTGIEDIIVTATRREERLQRIPVTVTAITGAGLATAGVVDTRTLTQVVPGLNFGRSGLVSAPTIRGVGSSGVSNGDESNVAVYVDGVYQADATVTQMDLVRVERVEVLRGPQGTVFGRNATGGLINVITPDPQFDTAGSISASYGRSRNDSNWYDVRGYLTGPISEVFAGDVSVLYRKNDGYIVDLVRGGTLGRERLVNIRSKLLFAPSDTEELILTGEYANQRSQAVTYETIGQARGGAFPGFIPRTGPWQATLSVLPKLNYEKYSISLRSSFDLGGVQLETTGAYQYSNPDQITDGDSTNTALSIGGPNYTTKVLSQEVRLLSDNAGPFTWLAGVYAFRLKSVSDIVSSAARTVPAGQPGAGNPIAGLINFTLISPDIRSTSFAGFVEGTLQVAEPLFVTLGARYTTEKRSFEQGISANVFENNPRGINDIPSPGLRTVTLPRVSQRFNKATYRGAVRYQITPDTNIYGSYGTGFKSGVYNVVTTRVTAFNNGGVVNPETIKAAEIGVKSDITRGVRLNLSAFQYNYDDLQVSSRAPDGTYFLQNAARAKIQGGEAELTLAPVRGLTMTVAAAYARARYRDYAEAQCFTPIITSPATPLVLPGNQVFTCDASGNTLVRAPKLTLNFSPRYEFDLGSGKASLGGNIYRSSRVYYDFANNYSQKPFALVNAQAAYRTNGNVEFSLSVTNLTNEVVFQQIRIGVLGTDVLLERPRRVTAGMKYTF